MVEETKKQMTVEALMSGASKRSGKQMDKAFSLLDNTSDSDINFSKTYIVEGVETKVETTITLTKENKVELQGIFGVTEKELVEAVQFTSSDRLDQLNGMRPIISSMRKAINPLTESFEGLPEELKAKYTPVIEGTIKAKEVVEEIKATATA